MTGVARAVQAVRPHIPMIKFPDRSAAMKPSLQAMNIPKGTPAPTISAVSSQSPSPATRGPVYDKPVGYTPRGSGAEWHTLPARYQRKPISQEEMEYIERGGPDL